MSEATPGPWKITPRRHDGEIRPTPECTISHEGEFIATADKINANLIVTAVNERDAMLAVVSAARRAGHDGRCEGGGHPESPCLCGYIHVEYALTELARVQEAGV